MDLNVIKSIMHIRSMMSSSEFSSYFATNTSDYKHVHAFMHVLERVLQVLTGCIIELDFKARELHKGSI